MQFFPQQIEYRQNQGTALTKGGKRIGAGRPKYNPDFLDWVHTEIRRGLIELALDQIKRRVTNEKGIQRLRKKLEFVGLNEEDLATAELEIAQAWKDGLAGTALLERLSEEMERKIVAVNVRAEQLPNPTPVEMAQIFRRVADRGKHKWSHCTPSIVKRAWAKVKVPTGVTPDEYQPGANAHPDSDASGPPNEPLKKER